MASTPRTPLTISPCTPPDLPALTTLYLTAFTLSSPTRRKMYANVPPAALHEYQRRTFSRVLRRADETARRGCSINPSTSPTTEERQQQHGVEEETYLLKCTAPRPTGPREEEAEGGEDILALAIWNFLPKGYDADADVAAICEDIPVGADERLWKDFAAETGRLRGGDKERLGRGEGHWGM